MIDGIVIDVMMAFEGMLTSGAARATATRRARLRDLKKAIVDIQLMARERGQLSPLLRMATGRGWGYEQARGDPGTRSRDFRRGNGSISKRVWWHANDKERPGSTRHLGKNYFGHVKRDV